MSFEKILDSVAKTRLPARVNKKRELLTHQDWDDYDVYGDHFDYEIYEYDYDTHPVLSNSSNLAGWNDNEVERIPKYGIRRAIADANEIELDFLLKQLHVESNQIVYTTDIPKWQRKKQITSEGHTLLTDAIIRGDWLCIEVILKNITEGFVYPTIIEYVCRNGRTALWYACSRGNFELVRTLVEDYHVNINKCGVLIVAAQNGHENIVEYLLRKGCDPNRRTKNYNERALHVAVRRNHLGMVTLLLNHGADPNILDSKERTALDYAIHKRHLTIAKLLINHLDGHFIMSQTGFTPFMLATRCNNQPIRDLLSNRLSQQQILDELALLACNYIIYGITDKRNEAYSYFEQILTRKPSLCNLPTCEAYEFLKECQTFDELARIRDNDNAMRMHALLVYERILSERNESKHLIPMIMKQSDVYKMHRELHRCLQFRIHAYQLLIQTADTVRHHRQSYETILRKLANILFQIFSDHKIISFETFVLVWTWALRRVRNTLAEMFFRFICLATHVSFFFLLFYCETAR